MLETFDNLPILSIMLAMPLIGALFIGVFCRGDRAINAEIAIDSFNILNHANLINYIGVLSSPLFGTASGALDSRQMQFSFQLGF